MKTFFLIKPLSKDDKRPFEIEERLSKSTHKPMTAKEKQEIERMKNAPFYGSPSKL